MRTAWNIFLGVCVVLILACMVILCGCTTTKASYTQARSYGEESWTTTVTGERMSFMQKIHVYCGLDTNGFPVITYSTDGGAETAGAAAGTALKKLIR